MMAILLSGLWEAGSVEYRLALMAAWVQWLCLALVDQVYKSPKALVSRVVVVERVAHRFAVAERVAWVQAACRSVRVACRLAPVESPAVLVVVPGTWRRHNLGRTPGRV